MGEQSFNESYFIFKNLTFVCLFQRLYGNQTIPMYLRLCFPALLEFLPLIGQEGYLRTTSCLFSGVRVICVFRNWGASDRFLPYRSGRKRSCKEGRSLLLYAQPWDSPQKSSKERAWLKKFQWTMT